MFAIVKNEKIIWFTDNKITKDTMLFDELIEWDFDIEKQYIFENWNIVEFDTKNKIEEIKEKYKKIIFDKYSLTDQLNLSQEELSITAIVAFEKRDFTEEESSRLSELLNIKKWIDEQRKACQLEIENLSTNQ